MQKEICEVFDHLDSLTLKENNHGHLTTETHGDELLIQGDIAGLLTLARQILYVAKSGTSGHHIHFDEASNLDKCDGKFIIGLKTTVEKN